VDDAPIVARPKAGAASRLVQPTQGGGARAHATGNCRA
jgi:hypothetical protein